MNTYKIEYSTQQWEEIEAMSFPGFEPVRDKPMSRAEWIAIGHIAMGKARRIEEGAYGIDEDNQNWIEDLEDIAQTIFNRFKPGDGNI